MKCLKDLQSGSNWPQPGLSILGRFSSFPCHLLENTCMNGQGGEDSTVYSRPVKYLIDV